NALGRTDEAIRWMRLKLQAQEKLGLNGRELYTSYANLGTFLTYANAAQAMQGDPQAQESMREAITCLRKAIEVNPQAHFGREIWQANFAEFLLAASRDRKLLLEYDMIGNSLQVEYQAHGEPRALGQVRRGRKGYYVRAVKEYLDDPADARDSKELREAILRV